MVRLAEVPIILWQDSVSHATNNWIKVPLIEAKVAGKKYIKAFYVYTPWNLGERKGPPPSPFRGTPKCTYAHK